MAILTTDIVYRLSGGASNTLQIASIGGAKSSSLATAGIFDDVTAGESSAGDIEYRCVYVHNGHATITLKNAVAWISANTPSGSTTVDVAVGNAAVGATETVVADENTAPSGPTFIAAANKAGGAVLGDIPAGSHRAIWIRRTVTAGAAAFSDGFTIRAEGDTTA